MSADRIPPLPAALPVTGPPMHATLLVADIERFSSRDGAEQMRTREARYGEFEDAFTEPSWAACIHEDRGDGLLVVIPQQIPKAAVLGEILPRLESALGRRQRGDSLLRMRIAVHAGDVSFDEHGIGGHAMNRTFRLCNSDPLRRAIGTARSDLAVLVSDAIHEDVVRGGYAGIAPQAFHSVEVRVKEAAVRAWLHVPGDPEAARHIADEPTSEKSRTFGSAESSDGAAPGKTTPRDAGTGVVSLSAGGDLRLGPRNVIARHDITGSLEARCRRWWQRG